ncbi:MAG: sn-glycerol-1-phosphate dehydrogenase [Alphaproteobacteria bacterium]
MCGAYADPDGGTPLAVPTRAVVIADSLAGDEADLVAALGLGARLALVSDANTHRVLGARVARSLAAVAEVSEIRLPDHPRADQAAVGEIRDASVLSDALIAVGSGTINDLCKYVAALDGKPYAVFATAPSMNGYTSVNAAITVDGHKKSLPATAAAGVFLDLEVLAGAPPRMIRSGLGDSLCRPTAQADWLLSHLLLDTPYRRAPFALLAGDEDALLAESDALMRGDAAAMRRLARTLVLSGFGMAICGGSHPASEGEHLISHYVEMMTPSSWPESFHGEQIGVATLTMARLQERLLAAGPPRLNASVADETSLTAHFGDGLGAACWREFANKRLDAARAETLNARIEAGWDDMCARLSAVTRSASEIEAALTRAGAPTAPEALGWPRVFYRDAVRHAREIRDRYTFLDLAADGGLLDGDGLV